jgi:hypothetical protein
MKKGGKGSGEGFEWKDLNHIYTDVDLTHNYKIWHVGGTFLQ